MDFLHICRQDLDRLIEQSPPIPDDVIELFEKEFKDVPNLNRPDICHGLEHTVAFNSTKPRLMKMVAEATIYLKQKKKLLRDDILPDITDKITLTVRSELDKKLEEMEKKRIADAVPSAPEPEPPAVAFNYSGNWRRLINVTRADSVRPNPFTEHEDVVEADDEAIFTPRTPRDMVINMIVEPDSPVAVPEQPQPNVSHTMHFD